MRCCKPVIAIICLSLLGGCTSASSPEPTTASPSATSLPEPTQTTQPTETPDLSRAGCTLADFDIDLSQPFAPVTLKTWQPVPYTGQDYALPVSIWSTANPQVTSGLTPEQLTFLSQNGFVVIHSQEPQFVSIRNSVTNVGQPYFITTDAALHMLHLDFDDLLKALERDYLRPQMEQIAGAVYQEVLLDLSTVEGTEAEDDYQLAAAYLGTALTLFNPDFEPDGRIETQVKEQVEQIMAGEGRAFSVLFPTFEDDYGAYRPVGHYAGDPALEAYFRGMTWLGRVHFELEDGSRIPLILTLALRRAELENGEPAADAWGEIHELLTFLIGPTDDPGPMEFAPLMDEVYGRDPVPSELVDDALWEQFVSLAEDQLPAPQINSTFVDWQSDLPLTIGWRFIGQRFTVDGYIFQNLVFDAVRVNPDTRTRRLLPTGPDVMAVLGSPVAVEAVTEAGAADYPNYLDQVASLQEGTSAKPQDEWLTRFYDSWLYVFQSILSPKEASYPAYMQTDAWAYREQNTARGSWTELKHDTILYTKMPEGMGGGGPPTSGPPPMYVEANPDAFYRMAYAAQALREGLVARGVEAIDAAPEDRFAFGRRIESLESMAEQFEAFGDIAVKELAGEPLDEEDYWAIGFGAIRSYVAISAEHPEPTPVIAAVAGAEDNVLEAATGAVDRIYVIVPIDGQLMIAQGGVYSYYEITQPRSQRLTDQEWRERLTGTDAPSLPVWASHFVFEGGSPARWLVFRVGDAYSVTEAGDNVNVRGTPSPDGAVLGTLAFGDLFRILEGPVESDGYTWWKVQIYGDTPEGWIVEDQEWYQRSNP